MRGTSLAVVYAFLAVAGCGAGDNRIDPGDLELRDLLGVSPEAATAWDAPQRAAARRVLSSALHDEAVAPTNIELEPGATDDDRIVHALVMLDSRRFAAGDGALGVVRVKLGVIDLLATSLTAPAAADALDKPPATSLELQLSDRWDAWPALPGRGLGLLAAVAADAGHTNGAVIVVPAARLPVVAAYRDGHLVVNPVVLAALEPDGNELAITTEHAATPPPPVQPAAPTAAGNGTGNPYSFYGSVAECAAAQRTRCEACLPNSSCKPITTASDGNAECTMLAAQDGRGYFLECINLALAISSVYTCAGTEASSCARNPNAADSLTDLESNASFLDNATCSMGLDTCLTEIYGPPSQTFPGIVDGGTSPPPQPPRSTSVGCGDSCSNNNANCTASPNCDCSGPSCNNSLSCDSGCSSSNHQGGGCDSCSSDSTSSGGSCGGGSSSSSGGSCDSCNNSSSSGGGNCGSCGSSSSSSGGGCSSCDSSSSSSGGSCGSCGSGGSCGGSSGGSSCGGSSGKCSVAKAEPSAGFALAMSVFWAFMPVPLAAVMKRRSRKRKPKADATPPASSDEEVAS